MGTPLNDFFNKYVMAKVNGIPVISGSKHQRYIDTLKVDTNYLVRNPSVSSESEVVPYINGEIEGLATMSGNYLKKYKIALRIPYVQALDKRPFQYKISKQGWCLGAAAYWLKGKKDGNPVLPDEFYINKDLSTANGTIIRLMLNQDKMRTLGDSIKRGSVDPRAKNALDYVMGGRCSPTALTMRNESVSLRIKRKLLHEELLEKNKKYHGVHGTGHKDLFLGAMFFEGGGGHAVALDLSAGQLFDPNFGVFSHITDQSKFIARFLYEIFLHNTYDNVSSFALYRCC